MRIVPKTFSRDHGYGRDGTHFGFGERVIEVGNFPRLWLRRYLADASGGWIKWLGPWELEFRR